MRTFSSNFGTVEKRRKQRELIGQECEGAEEHSYGEGRHNDLSVKATGMEAPSSYELQAGKKQTRNSNEKHQLEH